MAKDRILPMKSGGAATSGWVRFGSSPSVIPLNSLECHRIQNPENSARWLPAAVDLAGLATDILSEATLPEIEAEEIDLQAARFDHLRDLRKHAADAGEVPGDHDELIRG